MKPSSNNRRPRSRGNNKRQGGGGRNSFDSNGPDGKVRGTAQQVFEKYQALARDAFSAGDRITAEAFFQFAEHYYRIYHADNANAQAKRERQDQQRQDQQRHGHNNSSQQPPPQQSGPENKVGENTVAENKTDENKSVCAELDEASASTNVTVVPINEQAADRTTPVSETSDETDTPPRKKTRTRRPRTTTKTTKMVKNDDSGLPASMLPDTKTAKDMDVADAETPSTEKDTINA